MNPERRIERNEFVEPQAEEAVRILESKGYVIGTLMGQSGKPEDEKQAVVFDAPRRNIPDELNYFDGATVEKLKALGVVPFSGALFVDQIAFEFSAKGLTLEEIRKKWVEIANALPVVEEK